MAGKESEPKKILKDEEEMRKRYKMLLQLRMVEMVRDLDLLSEGDKKAPSGKPEEKK